MRDNWYRVDNESELFTPAVILYPDRIKRNIAEMIRLAGGTQRLRPHVKTHKLPQVVELQQAAGIDKFKCATLQEATMLASIGVPDVLLAYQPTGPLAERFVRLAATSDTRFSTLVDNAATVDLLNRLAGEHHISLPVYVDIDCGMHRTGIAPALARDLYRKLASADHLTAAGLHVYDGHNHEPDLVERTRICDQDYAPVQDLIDGLREDGLDVPEIVCGGSVSFPIHAQHPERTLGPGTCLLWDDRSSSYKDMAFEHAAVLATRVISKPNRTCLTLDAGHKSVASEMPGRRLFLLDLPDHRRRVHSEEHLGITADSLDHLDVGDVMYAIPYHICPTMALHEHVYVAENGRVTGKWEVSARKRVY